MKWTDAPFGRRSILFFIAMIILTILLLFAPSIIFVIDQMSGALPFDGLTVSLVLGIAGVILLAVRQRHALGRLVLALLLGAAFVALQVYAIAYLVAGSIGNSF